MSKFNHHTQIFNFDTLMNIFLDYSKDEFGVDNAIKTPTILALTSGIPLTHILFNCKWGDLLEIGSDSEIRTKDDISSFANTEYKIRLPKSVKKRILYFYKRLVSPNLDSFIYPMKLVGTTEEEKKELVKDFGGNMVILLGEDFASEITLPENVEIDEDLELDCVGLIQTAFGRRVFEIYGYSDKILLCLKLHLGLKTKEQLFELLGYESKKDIKYSLGDINLFDVETSISLPDLNFNNGKKFQKFTSFYKFINDVDPIDSFTDSINILLLLSLLSGKRPSALISMKWSDLIYFNKSSYIREMIDKELSPVGKYEKTFYVQIKHNVSFGGIEFRIPESLKDRIILHFDAYGKSDEWERPFNSYSARLTSNMGKPAIDFLNKNIFTNNNGKPLSQGNISRTIKKGLVNIGFPFAHMFTPNSTEIMWGRRIIEIKGNNYMIVSALAKHFGRITIQSLCDKLEIEVPDKEEKGTLDLFELLLYDYD